jgi:hypothetical protein
MEDISNNRSFFLPFIVHRTNQMISSHQKTIFSINDDIYSSNGCAGSIPVRAMLLNVFIIIRVDVKPSQRLLVSTKLIKTFFGFTWCSCGSIGQSVGSIPTEAFASSSYMKYHNITNINNYSARGRSLALIIVIHVGPMSQPEDAITGCFVSPLVVSFLVQRIHIDLAWLASYGFNSYEI